VGQELGPIIYELKPQRRSTPASSPFQIQHFGLPLEPQGGRATSMSREITDLRRSLQKPVKGRASMEVPWWGGRANGSPRRLRLCTAQYVAHGQENNAPIMQCAGQAWTSL
jgi:hypothetical protein